MDQPAPTHQEDRRAILAHIDSIFRAFTARDREALKQTHMPDFKGFTVRSRSTIRDREQYLSEIEGLLAYQVVSGYRIREDEFVFFGDTAVVCYLADVDGTGRQGATFTTELRIMDVYHRTPDGWNLAASSVSLHPNEISRHLSAAAKAQTS